MICRYCGTKVPKDSRFCENCGASLENNYNNVEVLDAGAARKEAYTFKEAIISMFSNYANFSGRATRSEYWWAFLFLMIVNLIAGYIPVLGVLISLALLIPNWSLNVRRLHDIGKSGWYMLMGLIPIVGIVILIFQYCKDPVGDNQWGPGPYLN